jgi:hypothetical protein
MGFVEVQYHFLVIPAGLRATLPQSDKERVAVQALVPHGDAY